jgi:hypothetical protein
MDNLFVGITRREGVIRLEHICISTGKALRQPAAGSNPLRANIGANVKFDMSGHSEHSELILVLQLEIDNNSSVSRCCRGLCPPQSYK